MRMRELLRATPVRMAFAFAASLLVVTCAVFAFIYVQTTNALVRRLEVIFVDEAEKAAHSDLQSLQTALSLRLTRDFRRLDYLALYNEKGQRIFGNIMQRPDIPEDGAPHILERFQPGDGGDDEPTLFVAHARPDGGSIVLGRSLDVVSEMRRILRDALSFAILPLSAFALAIGVLFARKTALRIRAIEVAISAIMQGNLRARLPTSSGLDELDGVIRSVNLMLDEIERLLGQLASVGDNIAHDLRAPLVNIRCGLERALAEDRAGQPTRASVAAALRQLDRALTTIAALLRISAIETARRASAFGPIDLSALCAELYEFYEPLARAKGVAMELRAEKPATMRGDADLMREAIANLIDNALKFTPRGGSVRIEARPASAANGPRLIVSDTGRGVPAAERGDIFRRFVRAGNGADQPGNGIGLSIAETIARQHGMSLTVADNQPGARFEMKLEL